MPPSSGGASGGGASAKTFGAPDFDTPNNADWAVNSAAALATDSNNAALSVILFDDTTEEGIGFELDVPAAPLDNLTISLIVRAETAPGGATTATLQLYTRVIPDDAVIGAWSAAVALPAIAIPTNEFWQYASATFTYAALGLTASRRVQFELTRDPGGLTGDLALLGFTIDWS